MLKWNLTHRFYLSAILLPVLAFSGAAGVHSAFAGNKNDELKKINQQLHHAETRLEKNRQQQNLLNEKLKNTEKNLSEIEARKRVLSRTISQQRKTLTKLQTEEKQLQQARNNQEKAIADQLYASYRLGRGHNTRVLLDQNNSRDISRMLTYSDYLAHARMEVIATYETTLASIADNQKSIQLETAELEKTKTALEQQQAKAKVSYAERSKALKNLQASIKTDEGRILQLKENQTRLRELLRQIEAKRQAAEKARKEKARRAAELDRQKSTDTKKPVLQTTDLADDHVPFAKSRGNIPWPTKGKLVNQFGQARAQGGILWQGVVFTAPAGTEISAVHDGKVVFADWFRGKGLLLIIDHGDGYMTLYAHNQTLLKQTGELVEPGDIIATVGNSGGIASPELYFELRYQGEPVNPGPWLKKKG